MNSKRGSLRLKHNKTLEHVYYIVDSIEFDEYGCKPWPHFSSQKYPTVTINGKGLRVSRIVLERKLGRPITPGLFVLHTCDFSPCVNQEHLYEGTKKDNTRDIKLRDPETYASILGNLKRELGPEAFKKRWQNDPEFRAEQLARLAKGRETNRKKREASDE